MLRGTRSLGRTAQVLALAGCALLVSFSLIALFAPLLAPYDPTDRIAPPFLAPSAQHLLGTNDIGQDILSELMYGTRISLGVGIGVSAIATSIACAVGVAAGYCRGILPTFLMRGVDLVLVLPFLPLMLLVVATFGPGLDNQVLAMSFLLWSWPARILRSATLGVKTAGHVEAAVWTGGSTFYILRRHILPRIAPITVTMFVRTASIAIVLESSLAFLGLGDPVAKSWGTMLHYAHARAAIVTGAWTNWLLPPALCIILVVIAFVLVGLAIEQRADPRLGKRGWLDAS